MAKDLIIYSTQRSGTHFLTSLLRTGGNIRGLGEILTNSGENQKFYNFVRTQDYSESIEEIANDVNIFSPIFDAFIEKSKEEKPSDKSSFIIMYNQIAKFDKSILDCMLEGRDIVHLIRRNVLRTHVSDFINRNRLKPTHSRDRAAGEKAVKIMLPTDDLVETLEKRTKLIQRHQKILSQRDHVELSYEDLSEDNDLLRGLADKFGFEVVSKFSTGFKRTNPQPLSEILDNFADVQAALKGTDYLEMSMA